MVAGANIGHAGTDSLDDTRSLMTQHKRKVGFECSMNGMQIRMADAGCLHLDANLVGLRSVDLDFLDDERLIVSVHQRGSGSHRHFPTIAAFRRDYEGRPLRHMAGLANPDSYSCAVWIGSSPIADARMRSPRTWRSGPHGHATPKIHRNGSGHAKQAVYRR